MSSFQYKQIIDEEQKLIRFTFEGSITVDGVAALMKEARELAVQKGFGLLLDYRQAYLASSMADLYYYPRTIPHLVKTETKMIKTALLITKRADFEKWQFTEITTQNSGVNLRLFVDDEAETIRWLTK